MTMPIFNRPPRIQSSVPAETITIPPAPSLPNKPESTNWLQILLPIGAVFLSIILMVAFIGNSGILSYLLFIPVMLVSYIVTAMTASSQKKSYQQKLDDARNKFRASLKQAEIMIADTHKEEQRLRREEDPHLGECIHRARIQDSRLGERRPGDEDFLFPRLGIGTAPACFAIKTQDVPEHPPEYEKEYQFIDQLFQIYSFIPEIPIQVRLPLTGSIGLAGERQDVLDISRAFFAHVLAHHWVDEVKISVICKPDYICDWEWMSGLPHTSYLYDFLERSRHTQEYRHPAMDLMSTLEGELQHREQAVEARKLLYKDRPVADADVTPLPRLVLIFDYLATDFNHPALNLLLKKGRELGVYGVFLTGDRNDIPGECGAVLSMDNDRLIYEESGSEGYRRECIPDRLSKESVEELSRALADIEWPSLKDTSQPPDVVTFLQMFNARSVKELTVEEWWNSGSPFGYLRAPIGRMSATSNLIFDLNDSDEAHGPHGLLGGMTGSGKSETLKAIILALAVTHHPYDLNFALIDFKGGAAFNELKNLPHTVGVVTDIESNATYAERVIQALSGEIERRKRILESARALFSFGKSHVDDYRTLHVRRPLPRLLIVFDEFAEFKVRNPSESKKLIGIARQGRSLGVHLLLATQNVVTAVDSEIMQNSRYKICLRVADTQDSMQMIGIPDAITLNRGRAYFNANSRILYQSAYAGADYNANKKTIGAGQTFTRVWPDGRREELEIPHWERAQPEQNENKLHTEAGAVVDYLIEVARRMHIKVPLPVWPEPLPERLYLPEVLSRHLHLTGGWDGTSWQPCELVSERGKPLPNVFPILGLYDHPAQQRQYVLRMDSTRGSHLLIFGSSGSGKSTLLRSLVSSVVLTQSPAEAHIFILDFGGRPALKILEEFPHVGAVISRNEKERTERLVYYLRKEVIRRGQLLRAKRVDTWLDYNADVNYDEKLPALYLVIDNFYDLRQSFESDFIKEVTALVGGLSVGLFLIIATSLQSDLTNELFANISFRVTFNQATSTEYFGIVGQPSEARQQEDSLRGMRPGRGLFRGTPPLEFQACLPTIGRNDRAQSELLLGLASRMRQSWFGDLPDAIRDLESFIYLPESSLDVSRKNLSLYVDIGRDFEELAPIGFSLASDGPTYFITSAAPKAGKTTLLQTWLLRLAESFPKDMLEILLIDFHSRSHSALRKLPNLQYVGSKSSFEPILNQLSSEIDRRHDELERASMDMDNFDMTNLLRRWPHILLVIDDYGKFSLQTSEDERRQLVDCITRGGELASSYIVAGTLTALPRYGDDVVTMIKRTGCGILLGGAEGMDEFNNTPRPPGSPGFGQPPGRGYMIQGGRPRLFQTGVCWSKESISYIDDAIQKRVEMILNTQITREK